ncbi:MAG: aminotransferase class I/II-fold pyridoxal phosphate-dependent enzyme [Bacteroidota bacterium]|nr:aminotransferase class I/II-fold pyridoxal phosphate-dependent enzyme [Bacteroidota bacterium]
MNSKLTEKTSEKLIVSKMAENLIGSEIIKLASEVAAKIKNGEKIYNLTIGDFNPKIFPIPVELKQEIIKAYQNEETNYPPANGIAELRQAVSSFIKRYIKLEYSAEEVLIAGGARPLIYATYKALIDPGDTVLFPVPSWNNNHYCHLSEAQQVFIETKAENNFMPTAEELKPYIGKAQMLALCSPLNPTGTTFSKEGLKEICELVIEENKRRSSGEKPLYILYDQIYWALTYGNTKHFDPVSLYPELRDYTIFIDGLSKAFAGTGVRVGWAFGPQRIIDKMKSILGHVGAWAPKAEQIASANYLNNIEKSEEFLTSFRAQLQQRLEGYYAGFLKLKEDGFEVDAIAPQAAIYLTVQLNLHGYSTSENKVLATTRDITKYILDEAKIAIVPFSAFGASEDSTWYRISVGTTAIQDIEGVISNLRNVLINLKK